MTTRLNMPTPPEPDDRAKAAYDLSARLWGLMQQYYFLNRKEDEMDLTRLTPDASSL